MICTTWSWHCPVWKLWLWADRFIWMILNIYYWTGIWHCFSAFLTKTLLFEGKSITCWSGPCVSSAIMGVVYTTYMCLDWYFYKTDEIVQQPLKERDGNNYQNVDNCKHTEMDILDVSNWANNFFSLQICATDTWLQSSGPFKSSSPL